MKKIKQKKQVEKKYVYNQLIVYIYNIEFKYYVLINNNLNKKISRLKQIGSKLNYLFKIQHNKSISSSL